MTALSQASILRREIKFTSRVLTSVIEGKPIALDIKRALVRINNLLNDLVGLKQLRSEEVNSFLESDDFRHSLGFTRAAIEQALSSPVLITRPKTRAYCKNLINHLSKL